MEETLPSNVIKMLLTLSAAQRTGLLEVEAEGTCTLVYISRGVPVFAEEGTLGETLGRLLLREHRISPKQYAHIIEHMTETVMGSEQLRFGEVAVALGYLTSEQVNEALTMQVRRKIAHCMEWESAKCTFREEAGAIAGLSCYPCPVEPLALRVVQRRFDDARVSDLLQGCADRFPLLAPGEAEAISQRFRLQAHEAEWVRTLDGTRSTLEVIYSSAIGSLPAAQILGVLMLADAVQLSPSAVWLVPPPSRSMPAVLPSSPPPVDPAATPARGEPDARAVAVHSSAPAPRSPAPPAPATIPAAAEQPLPERPVPEPRAGEERAVPPAPTGASASPAAAASHAAHAPAPAPPRPAPASPSSIPEAVRRRLARRLARGVERRRRAPLGDAASTGAAATDAVSSTPSPSGHPNKHARLVAEQRFQTGKRHLSGQRWVLACQDLREAARLYPAAVEYVLYAEWARFCTLTDVDETIATRKKLAQLAGQALQQDERMAFGHFVRGQVLLMDGDERGALRAFRIAMKLDPSDKSAARYYRTLRHRCERKR